MGKPNKHGVDEDGFIIEKGFFGELGDDYEEEGDPFEEESDRPTSGEDIDDLIAKNGIPVSSIMDLGNLATIAPHKVKYIERYNIKWLKSLVDSGAELEFVTFWQADPGCENVMFSQWYKGNPFYVNGREYITAEQYMMSEKALLFKDYSMYEQIMNESDPSECKKMGRLVKNYDSDIWKAAFKEIIFHGNLSKLQSDINIVDALLDTGDAILVEASPYDDIYGAGLSRDELLNNDGSLKVHPRDWHKKGSTKQAENNLGFVLMGLRDLFRDLMPGGWED